MGVSGAPEKVKNHAEKIMDMALDMRDCVSFVKDPRPEFKEDESAHVKIRQGIFLLYSVKKNYFMFSQRCRCSGFKSTRNGHCSLTNFFQPFFSMKIK